MTFDLPSPGPSVSRHWLTLGFPWNGRCWSPSCRESLGSLTWAGCAARGPESWWTLRWRWRPPHRAPWPRCCSPIRHKTPRWALGGTWQRPEWKRGHISIDQNKKTGRIMTAPETEKCVTETEGETGRKCGKWHEKQLEAKHLQMQRRHENCKTEKGVPH